MTTTLRQATKDLAQALTTNGVTCLDHVPEAINPPLLILQPGENYLTGDEVTLNGSEYALNLEAYLTVELLDNEAAADDLDELLEHLLTQLPPAWGIDGIDQPGPIQAGDWLAHATRVRISRFLTL